jgi:N-acetylglucosamine-6-phosphate deacetylase
MKNKLTKLVNGQIITPAGILKDHAIIIRDGKIAEITIHNTGLPNNAEVIDAQGNYIAPGCIDFHLHGGGGHDFLEATPEAFYAIAEAHARYGITTIYATLAAAPRRIFEQTIKVCDEVMADPKNGARIMGLHLEGNYLNVTMAGGQDPACLYPPDPEEYKALLASTGCIKRWSASPELSGALDFARYATERGVLISLAHTVANYPLVKEAFGAGYIHATHFYNAMTGVHKKREFKYEGAIESIYLMEDMTVELVCDGIHVPPAILKLVHKFKGAERIALVTDAMFAAAYSGSIGDITGHLIIEDGVCKLADRSALASSIATGNRMIRVITEEAGVSLTDAVRMTSETPARIMRINDRKGSIEKGKDADIILFDTDINIRATFVEGKLVYRQSQP